MNTFHAKSYNFESGQRNRNNHIEYIEFTNQPLKTISTSITAILFKKFWIKSTSFKSLKSVDFINLDCFGILPGTRLQLKQIDTSTGKGTAECWCIYHRMQVLLQTAITAAKNTQF